MVRLCGSICIFAGCGYAWYLQWTQRRRQRNARIELLSALRTMEQEIRSRQTPIPHLAQRLAGESIGDVRHSFEIFRALLECGELPAQAWKVAFEELPLSEEEKAAVMELGNRISKEESIAVREINLTIDKIETWKESEEKLRKETEKRSSALWFSAAALLVILLI